MKDTSTISPASTNSLAASPTRRIFSTRSASVKPRSLVEAMADIVAVQQIGVLAFGGQALFHQIGDGGFARARQAGEPQHHRLLALHRGAGLLVHVQRLPMDIGGAAQAEIDHAGAHRGIGETVDQDKAAGVAIVAIGVEGQRLGQGEIGIAHLVERQGLGRHDAPRY